MPDLTLTPTLTPAEPDPAQDPPAGGALRRLVPAALRHARVSPGRRGLLVLLAVALCAAAVAAVGAWRARPQPEPIGAPPLPAEAARSTGPPTTAGPSAGTGEVVVSIAGKVRRPGLVRLPAGARVADAVAAVGGTLPGAVLDNTNLARRLVDGEHVVVGLPSAASPATPPTGGGAASGPGAPGAPVSLNAATVADLDELPGVGPVLAQRIVEYRERNGGFRTVEQLQEVDGIGEGRYADLKGLVTV
jgi:competence protein ComEA